MNGRGPIHFDVQLSAPYEHLDWQKNQVTSMRNITLDIITTSAQRAIELALARHPEGQVHVVQRRGSTSLLLDPDIIKELIDGDSG